MDNSELATTVATLKRCLDRLTDVINGLCAACRPCEVAALNWVAEDLDALVENLGANPNRRETPTGAFCMYCGQRFYLESGHTCNDIVTRKTAVSHG